MNQTSPVSDYEDKLILAVRPVIEAHSEQRLAEIRREIAQIEMRTTALASVIADMSRTDEDATEAEKQFAIALDRLMELRLDEGSLKSLKQPINV